MTKLLSFRITEFRPLVKTQRVECSSTQTVFLDYSFPSDDLVLHMVQKSLWSIQRHRLRNFPKFGGLNTFFLLLERFTEACVEFWRAFYSEYQSKIALKSGLEWVFNR